MPRFSLVKHPEDPRLRTLYREMVERGMQGVEEGIPINGLIAMGERPDLLSGMWEFTKSIVLQGSLPPTVKEMIGMVIAMQNNCRYCTVGHTHALEAMGVPSEVIKSCAADPELTAVSPSQRAMIQFALKTVRDPRSVTDADLQNLRDHGLSDGEIIELIMMASWATMINIWTEVSEVPVDGQEEVR